MILIEWRRRREAADTLIRRIDFLAPMRDSAEPEVMPYRPSHRATITHCRVLLTRPDGGGSTRTPDSVGHRD